MKLVVGLSGASGISLGIKFIQQLPNHIELFVIISESAKIVAQKELNLEEKSLIETIKQNNSNISILNQKEIWANISSGSFGVDKMAIIPTSMDMLAKISYGIADELISRCASVIIKEKKQLLLAPREMPFSAIALENMLKLSKLNVIISPPVIGYYAKINNLNTLENFIIGKWMDALEIENQLYHRWGK